MNPDRVNWHENLEFGPINPVRVKLRVEISHKENLINLEGDHKRQPVVFDNLKKQ